MTIQNKETIVLLDFGAQYSHLIARRIRSLHVYCEILPYHASLEEICAKNARGIIFSGGPASVLEGPAPRCHAGIFDLGIPILGICYGMQLITDMLGGQVVLPDEREYGKADIFFDERESGLLAGLPPESQAWMSHSLQVARPPVGFKPLAHTLHCDCAAFANAKRRLFGVQFHPEVTHTPEGMRIFSNFLFDICGCAGNWRME
ncbi:MAG: glutamine-hydrolyzing GMP synthase, partial [Clostridiales bacterium]|nr:glutamine-hydrolyzing GMP synthase [Clostridiales bacterium]